MKHTFYLSPCGCDRNDGLTPQTAFATPERAKQAVRQAKIQPRFEGAEVILSDGIWTLDQPLLLDSADGGIPGLGKVVWRAAEGARPVFTGAHTAAAPEAVTDEAILSRLQPAARPHVKMIDLAKCGIEDAGHFAERGGFNPAVPSHAELFSSGVRQKLARWPREGYVRNAGLVEGTTRTFFLHRGYEVDAADCFHYTEDRQSQWKDVENIVLFGYWSWDWADSYRRVTSIDTEKKIIRVTEPSADINRIKSGARYCALNVLEEIAGPGDMAIDFAGKRIYWWPDQTATPPTVSCLAEELIRMQGVTDFELNGITLREGRADGLTARSCARVDFSNLLIENVGNTAMIVSGGHHVRISQCEFTGTGDGCILIDGGDVGKLLPCNHEITDCEFHHFSTWSKTYKSAIRPTGCGMNISHNFIHDAPHCAILYRGADMRIEYNDIYRVALETDDVGAIYTGFSWVERGNVIRGNHIHGMVAGEDGFALVMGIYLDDFHSGQIVADNIVEDAEIGIMIGGGRDNLVEGNIFIHCKHAIHVDARGTSWASNQFTDNSPRPRSTKLIDQIRDFAVAQPPFCDRFPILQTYLDDQPELPKGNVLNENQAWECETLMRYIDDIDDQILAGNTGNLYIAGRPSDAEVQLASHPAMRSALRKDR